MVGVIVTSAFGTLYLERQLKASPKARKDMKWVGMGWDGVGVGSVLLTTHNREDEFSIPSKQFSASIRATLGIWNQRGVLPR